MKEKMCVNSHWVHLIFNKVNGDGRLLCYNCSERGREVFYFEDELYEPVLREKKFNGQGLDVGTLLAGTIHHGKIAPLKGLALEEEDREQESLGKIRVKGSTSVGKEIWYYKSKE